jgi:hypothetical protein
VCRSILHEEKGLIIMQAKSILEPKFTQHFFEYDNMKFFRENAFSVQLGSYGEKKDPAGARAYLDVHAKVKTETVAEYVRYTTAVDIDWNQVSSGLITANGYLPVFGMSGKAAAQMTFGTAKSARVKLMNFQVNSGPLIQMLNQDAAGARKYLAGGGSDGRICSGIWVWAEVEVTEQFGRATEISASVDNGASGLALTAKGGKLGSLTITVDSGTTCAYRLHKVKDWNKDKTRVEEVETDFKGIG